MVTVSIHQSQYIPWPPYIRKIASADIFVLMDNVQYQKNGVQNRNRVRNKDGDFWLTIPVTGHMDDTIAAKRISDPQWNRKHFRSLQMAYAKSPYWKDYSSDIERLYAQPADFLGQVNERFLSFILSSLGIQTRIVRLSELNINAVKSDLVLQICKALGAKVYISGLGAKDYLREDDFSSEGIVIEYRQSSPPCYTQFNGSFISGLSMIDMMFNAGSDQIRNYLFESAL